MRISLAALALGLCIFSCAAQADNPTELSGPAALLSDGVIMVDGHEVTLWGIGRLASDQECWHDSRAWDCGEQASLALRHHLASHHPVRCVVKEDNGDSKVAAQCFTKFGDHEEDMARYLVVNGWARDQYEVTGGLYADDEKLARNSRRGIWTSRFQTAEDWKNGVSRYVEYDMAPMKTTTATTSALPTVYKPQ